MGLFSTRGSFKIAPGVRVNYGKKGMTSVNVAGVNIKTSKSRSSQNTTSAQQQKLRQRQYETSQNINQVQQYNEQIRCLRTIHTVSTPAIDWRELNVAKEPFNQLDPGPRQTEALRISENYKPKFPATIIKSIAARRKEMLLKNIAKATIEDQSEYDEWYKKKILSAKILEGNIQAYLDVIREKNPFKNLIDFGYEYKYKVINHAILDVQYKVRTELVPDYSLSLTTTGKLSRKALTKAFYYELIQDYICSLSLRIALDLFAILPAEHVVVNAVDNAINGVTGHQEEIILLSIIYDRKTFDRLNISTIDPSDVTANFKHNMTFQKTSGLKPVDRITIT